MCRFDTRAALLCLLATATTGCAREQSPDEAARAERAKAAFQAARDGCGVTVADDANVQRCMRSKGYVYRLPWQ